MTLVTPWGLLSLVTFFSIASAASDNFTCPVWRTMDRLPSYLNAPDRDPNLSWWSGPVRMTPKTCLSTKSKLFQRDGVYTSLLLHQTEQDWQLHQNKTFALAEISDAIYTGLDLVGRFGGTPFLPLQIHATIVSGGDGKGSPEYDVQVNLPESHDESWPGDRCFLAIRFPYPTYHLEPDHKAGGPLVLFKKEIVNRLFRCVLQYHRPQMNGELAWWKNGVGRFIDGLAWALPEDSGIRPWGNYLSYPQWYNAEDAVWEDTNFEASAIFWYAAQNAGWALEDIFDWVKSFPREAESSGKSMLQVMSQDNKLCSMFHDFGFRLRRGGISYPSGQVIPAKKGLVWGWGGRDTTQKARPIAIPVGQAYDWPNRTERIYDQIVPINPWIVTVHNLLFDGGQHLNLTMSLGSDIWENPMPPLLEKDFQWSLRPSNGRAPGDEQWMTARGQNSSLQLVIPGTPGVPRRYELLMTYTQWYGIQPNVLFDGRFWQLRVEGLARPGGSGSR